MIVYYGHGTKHLEENYKNGKKDGLCTEWDSDGRITFQGNFVDGNER